MPIQLLPRIDLFGGFGLRNIYQHNVAAFSLPHFGSTMPRAMAAAAWCVALLVLLAPGAEAQADATIYNPANITGYVVGAELITNAQCKEVRVLTSASGVSRDVLACGSPVSRLFCVFRVHRNNRASRYAWSARPETKQADAPNFPARGDGDARHGKNRNRLLLDFSWTSLGTRYPESKGEPLRSVIGPFDSFPTLTRRGTVFALRTAHGIRHTSIAI